MNNELYAGRVIWNRSQWIRSAAECYTRRQVIRSRSEWIIRQDERLRIISDDLCQWVKDRQADSRRRIAAAVQQGMTKAAARSAGAGKRYLLSGLLRCAECLRDC